MLGFINVYKPQGITSNAVVQKIKKKFNIKKIGHMGTLDPIACGVLPIAVGKATRLFDYALDKVKTYRVIYDFGYETDSLDTTGNVVNSNGYIPSIEEFNNLIPEFLGESMQVPPNFSAKCINGTRAYTLARNGIEFELKPKLITIFDFKLLSQISNNQFEFLITCSSGTYIRAIGRDLAKRLNTYACMSFLERTATGNFNSNQAIKLDDLLNMELQDIVISPIDVFDSYDKIVVDNKTYTDLKNGIKVNLGNIINNTFVINGNDLVGIVKPNPNANKLDTFLGD